MVRLGFIEVALLATACGLAWGQRDPGDQVIAEGFAAPPAPAPTCSSGFSARKATRGTSTVRGGSRTRLMFQEVLTSEGGWSPSESDFLAPCRGLYYFSFHGVAQDGGDFTLALMKNNQYQVTAYGGKGSFQQGSNSALLLLNQGDLVHLELQQGSLYEHPFDEAYTSFSGFLVKAYNE
ncbi:cerebellin-1-like [Penaeus chinensis]|uniref:cerebellin-1-like n=1 Tax=Penaeus chinensis TaxID=139456 RepID=UPI001FB6D9F6|nr:cerebellin-1-like [Penaeus chinensis]